MRKMRLGAVDFSHKDYLIFVINEKLRVVISQEEVISPASPWENRQAGVYINGGALYGELLATY